MKLVAQSHTLESLNPGERLAVSITIDTPPAKGGRGFYVRATMTLNDGTTHRTHIDSERKKDLPGKIERKQNEVSASCVVVDANGTESTRYSME